MIHWVQFQKGAKDVEAAFQDEKLHLSDQLSLFLNYLRLGLFELDLADCYDCSLSTISRTLITWANFLYFFVGFSINLAIKRDVEGIPAINI